MHNLPTPISSLGLWISTGLDSSSPSIDLPGLDRQPMRVTSHLLLSTNPITHIDTLNEMHDGQVASLVSDTDSENSFYSDIPDFDHKYQPYNIA